MSESIEIQYRLDRESYAKLIRKRLVRSRRFHVSLGLMTLALILISFGGNIFYVLLCLIVYCLAMGYRLWQMPLTWLKSAPYLTEEKTVRFTADRIFTETPSVKSEIGWTNYIAWCEDSDYLMLYLVPTGFCSAFPKSAFSEEQLQQFRDWAANQLPAWPKMISRQ